MLIYDATRSNLRPDARHTDWKLSWFSLYPPGIFRYSAANNVMALTSTLDTDNLAICAVGILRGAEW